MEENKRIDPRQQFDAKVEFIVDADILQGKTMDVSESGIRFSTSQTITVLMRYEDNGELKDRSANLVWAERQKSGCMEYGLSFLPDENDLDE